MARPLRIAYPGAFYHVVNRGVEQRIIFADKTDYASFLALLERLHAAFGCRVHSYCLMPNHYHLYLETPKGHLPRLIQQLDGRYTQRFNRRHRRSGPLFQGRYKALLVDKEAYSLAVARYIHLNPVKAKLVRKPQDYPWSSYATFLGQRSPAVFQETTWLLGQLGRSPGEARRALRRFTMAGLQDSWDPFRAAEGGVLLGDDRFVAWVRRRFLPRRRDGAISQLRQLQRPRDLSHIEKAVARLAPDPRLRRKVLVYALRRFTPLTLREVGDRVGGMRAVTVSQVVRRLAHEGSRPGRIASLLQRLERRMSNVKL
ncbi:MAG: transposase [Candidatus Methylomirabilales bacterium]